jgi:hypothetical protein
MKEQMVEVLMRRRRMMMMLLMMMRDVVMLKVIKYTSQPVHYSS